MGVVIAVTQESIVEAGVYVVKSAGAIIDAYVGVGAVGGAGASVIRAADVVQAVDSDAADGIAAARGDISGVRSDRPMIRRKPLDLGSSLNDAAR